VVEPLHNKAMPVRLITGQCPAMLTNTVDQALELQTPASDDAVAVRTEKVAA
jgi:hypothetical protein